MRRAARTLAFLLWLPPAAWGRAPGGNWHETLSPHFQVFHESAFAPPGFVLSLERMHNRLRMDLALFAPWMAKERVKVYLYKEKNSYLGGTFKPPSWSNGIADYRKRLIVTHEQGGAKKLMEVVGHEMTHLLFEGYWGEQNKEPPVWLNEGLAMAEEAEDPRRAEASDWYQAMGYYLKGGNFIRLERFLRLTPARDLKDQQSVTLWYVEAYSLVYFLLRRNSRLQFFNFCESLREGRTLDYALWKVYRYHDLPALEQEWMRWLKLPEVQQTFSPLVPKGPDTEASQGGDRKKKALREIGFPDFSFHGLIPDR